MLGKHGYTYRVEHCYVGGAISNAEDAKFIVRRMRYEAMGRLVDVAQCVPWLVPVRVSGVAAVGW